MARVIGGGLALLGSCHPGPVVAVSAAATGYAVALGRGPSGSSAVALAVLSGQLSIGWQNDALDAGRDRAAGRRDKPVAAGRVSVRLVAGAALLALVACVPLSLASGWRAGLVHLAAVASASAYNLGLKKTVLSFAPYSVSFALLPVFVALGAAHAPLGPWWAALGAGLLGTGAHFVNVVPDRDEDLAAGIAPLPHRLAPGVVLVCAAALLLGASAVITFGPARGSGGLAIGFVGAAVLTAGAVAAARRPGSRAGFGLVLVVACYDVALLIAEAHLSR